MGFHLESIPFKSCFLTSVHSIARKLDYLPATRADKMMMMLMSVRMLKSTNTVIEHDLASKAAFGDQLHRPVNSGISNLALLVHEPVKILHRQMILGLEESVKHPVPLRCAPQALRLDETFENLSFLADQSTSNRS